jgi:2-iminobutanoate/2-iminopropanoate deaminase
MAKAIKKKAMSARGFLNEPSEYNKSFSRGMLVDLGESCLCVISGTASIDSRGASRYRNNFSAQAQRTFDNITALLRSENVSWRDVIQTRCYLKDMKKYYEEFNEVRNRFYQKHKLSPFPASVCVQARLCRPELLVEIEALAVFKKR